MTEDEIVRSYRNAKNRNTQITVLAQLNACQTEEIEQILEQKGVIKKKQDVPEMPEVIKEMITVRMIEITEQMDKLGEELKELSDFVKADPKKEEKK